MSKPGKSYRLWIFGKLFRTVLLCLLLTVIAFLLWRVLLSGKLPREMREILPNAALHAAYRENGDTISAFTQEQSTITREDDNYGYFSVPRFVFLPQAKQLQVVFRYNNSTLKAAAKDFNLAEVPPAGKEVFDVSLSVITDLTPGQAEDNIDGSESLSCARIKPSAVTVKTTKLYTYFLYTFENVQVASDTLVVYFDIYYGGAVDYSRPAYGTLRLYHNESPCIPVTLSRKEKKAISDFSE